MMISPPAGEAINQRNKTKYVHEGQNVAGVDVELIEDETEWSPYLRLNDAYKLDAVREALRDGDLQAASNHARLYELRTVAHQ